MVQRAPPGSDRQDLDAPLRTGDVARRLVASNAGDAVDGNREDVVTHRSQFTSLHAQRHDRIDPHGPPARQIAGQERHLAEHEAHAAECRGIERCQAEQQALQIAGGRDGARQPPPRGGPGRS